ncbi:MAG: hypothetical protein IJW20_06390 [Clostridia bacterium]|nr:hypothetical protein [Clostridia bacterium]
MEEKGKISDVFNPLNGDKAMREKVLQSSNKLAKMGIDSPGQIERIYKAGDFLAFNDPLKLRNLEMFGLDNEETDQMFFVEVMDRERGYKVYQLVNTSDSDNMKRGDILTLDPTRESKGEETEFDPNFAVKYLANIIRNELNIPRNVIDSDEELLKMVGIKDISDFVKTYEDVVYMAAKKGGFKAQILERINTPEVKRHAIMKLKEHTGKTFGSEEDRKTLGIEDTEEEQNEEGMSIEETAETLGIEEEKLKKVAGDSNRVLGVRTTNDIAPLSKQLDYEFGNSNSRLILLKIRGEAGATQGIVLDTEGNEKYSPKYGDTKLITELVRDGAVGDNIPDINQAIIDRDADSKKIRYIDPTTGKEVVEYAQEGKEREVDGYESDAKVIMQKVKSKIDSIRNSDIGSESEKLDLIADELYKAAGDIRDLQTAYTVDEKNNINSLEDLAGDYSAEAEVEGAKEAAGEVVAGVVSGIGVAMFGRERGERLSRDEEAMRRRGYDVEGE